MRALIALALIAVASPRSDACPAGSPCTKYRDPAYQAWVAKQLEPPHVQPLFFRRDVRGPLPKLERKRIAKFLIDARWTPIYEGDEEAEAARAKHQRLPLAAVTTRDNNLKLHFVDPTRKLPKQKWDERLVLIREIEETGGAIWVEVDGLAYELSECRKKVACLTPTARAFSEVAPVDATDASQPSPAPPPPAPPPSAPKPSPPNRPPF